MTETRIKWNGAAAIIMRDKKLLMVKDKGMEGWSIPSGGMEEGETPETACLREVWEETGFNVVVKDPLHIKEVAIDHYDVKTHYFYCEIEHGEITYHDPDELVEEIAWKTFKEVEDVKHVYGEDREMLLSFFDKEQT